MTKEKERFPHLLWPEYEDALIKMDVYDQQIELRNFLRNNPDLPDSGYRLEGEQKDNLRARGILTWGSELAIAKGTEKVRLQRYTRKGTGLPVIDSRGPQPIDVELPQNGHEPYVQMIFRHAYYKSPELLRNELEVLLGQNKTGLTLNDIDKTVGDAWMLVSPAFKHMGLHPSREPNSNKDISASHLRELTKYTYAKHILKLHAPIGEAGGSGSGQVPFMPWPLSDAIAQRGMFEPDSANQWDISPEGIINDLYFGSNWLVNLPGFPGQKRFIPKNIPFPFATEMSNSEAEFWVGIFQDLGSDFKSYLDEVIYKDQDSNISVYVDVSKTGEGLSFYQREIGSLEGTEKLDTLITWQEWGEFISMRSKFNVLVDMQEWFKGTDEWFKGIPVLNMSNKLDVVKWFQKSRLEKTLSILKDTEDTLEEDSSQYRMNRSIQNSAFIDDTNLFRLGLNKLGAEPQSDEVSFKELQRWWILGISFPRGFGVSPSEWRDEINWAQALFGQGTEFGHLEKEAVVDFLIAVNDEFPDLNRFTEKDFERILNQEMGKYVLTEEDWWDGLSSNASEFGLWAKRRLNLLRSKENERTGTSRRQNPNR